MMNKGRTKIIFFIIILIIFTFEKAFANSRFLSEQCKKHLTDAGVKSPSDNLLNR